MNWFTFYTVLLIVMVAFNAIMGRWSEVTICCVLLFLVGEVEKIQRRR